MIDRYGHDYEDLLKIQADHLTLWKQKLRPELYEAVQRFVELAVIKAPSNLGEHRIYRGQDLVEIIKAWPKIPEGYAQPGEELI